MKKLLVFAVIAILVLALVACGDDAATTTKGDAVTTAPVVDTTAPAVADTTAPAVADTTAPAVVDTTAPVTTAPVTTAAPAFPTPVEDEINALMETSWWSGTTRRNLSYVHKDDGTTGYVWTCSMSDTSMLPTLPEDHPEKPLQPTLQLTSAEGARCFIKALGQDVDYKEYKVINWAVQRHCDFWFEAEGFVPEAGVEYDMFIFFVSPEEALYPGDYVYVWTLGDTWTYIPQEVSGVPEIDALIETAYQCTLHRHSKRFDISYPTDANAYDFDPSTFPTMNFSFTIVSDNTFPHLEEGQKAWQYVNTENGYVYLRVKGSEGEFIRYDIDYMLLARHCDMWFTLKDFTPVENQEYEMYVFFTAGYGAAHPYALHYVYTDSWIAGPHE